jgi:glycosyltransferase involved in cell wall biosynthesis
MLFSIIIPTFNRVDKLKVAINSVLTQTNSNFELIIVDDGSTDNTKEFVTSIDDPRINYVYQENSGLPSVGRNNGVSLAKNEWICFLDSDDYWENNKLERIAYLIKNDPSVDVWSHSEYLVDSNNNKIKVLRHSPKSLSHNYFDELLFVGNFLSPSAISIKRSLFNQSGGFDCSPDFFSVEDFELWLRLAKNGKFGFTNEVLGNYLIDGNGISSQTQKHMKCLKNVYIKHINQLQSPEKAKLLTKKLHQVDITTSRLLLKEGNFKSSRSISLTALKSSPLNLKAFVIFLASFFKIKI